MVLLCKGVEAKKYKRDCTLSDLMRQEHVTLYNVQISELYDRIKEYLKGLKLDIVQEEKDEDYWDIKAHKGGRGSMIVQRQINRNQTRSTTDGISL